MSRVLITRPSDRQIFGYLLRNYLSPFLAKAFGVVAPGQVFLFNWHIDALAYELELCARGITKRLLITMPPRYLKSICASVAFVAWTLGRDPTARLICVSYSQELSDKHARDTRAVMESPWYREIFPGTVIDRERNTVSEFMTTRRGMRLATSVLGQLTGRGGNFIIIDDPQKPVDALSEDRRKTAHEWITQTLFSRLDNKENDVIILVQQRLHENDLAGQMLEQGGWRHLDLPAIAQEDQLITLTHGRTIKRVLGDLLHPDRESKDVLNRLSAEMGSAAFAAQYLQRPTPLTGNMIKREWLRTYDTAPQRLPSDLVVQSWDTASKPDQLNDWSVCTTWLVRGNDFHLLNVWRQRVEYPDLRKQALKLASDYSPNAVIVEDKGSGIQLIQDLRRDRKVNPIPFKPELDKVTRLFVQTATMESGHVHLPRSSPWLEAFVSELLSFPNGRHDDQVDSVSQVLAWHKTRREPMRFY